VLDRKAVATIQRRDTRPLGIARRKRFDESLELLRVLGLSPDAIEQYREFARRRRKLPHELVRTMAEHAADDTALLAIVTSRRRFA
jgi:hypothetical protein